VIDLIFFVNNFRNLSERQIFSGRFILHHFSIAPYVISDRIKYIYVGEKPSLIYLFRECRVEVNYFFVLISY